MVMLPRILSSILLMCIAAAPTGAQTSRNAAISGIADLDSAARSVLSPVPQESREAMDWLVRHGDRGWVALLIQLLRWLPEEREVLVARLETLTGAHVDRTGSTGWCGSRTIRKLRPIRDMRGSSPICSHGSIRASADLSVP